MDEEEQEDHQFEEYGEGEEAEEETKMSPVPNAADPTQGTVDVVDKSDPQALEIPLGAAPAPPEKKGPDLSVHRSERAMLIGFLAGMIERFKLVSLLPGADASGDSSIKMDIMDDDGYEVLKAMMLDNASLVLRPFHRGAKPSKFGIEVKWLSNVFVSTLEQVEEDDSFSSLADTVLEGERREKHLPDALDKIKQLTSEMHELRQSLVSEAATHKVMEREWNKTLSSLKQGIKALKKENKIQAKYRADVLAATSDCNRRDRDVGLKALREESEKYKNKIEAEKRINTRCMEFIKNQNLQLMEEAISLQANLEVDMVQMDVMMKRIREQRNEKQLVIDELEPRYVEEMARKKQEEEEEERRRNISIEQQGQNEMKLRATMKIQRMYRGFKSRLVFKKELKKWRKKQKKDGKKKK